MYRWVLASVHIFIHIINVLVIYEHATDKSRITRVRILRPLHAIKQPGYIKSEWVSSSITAVHRKLVCCTFIRDLNDKCVSKGIVSGTLGILLHVPRKYVWFFNSKKYNHDLNRLRRTIWHSISATYALVFVAETRLSMDAGLKWKLSCH